MSIDPEVLAIFLEEVSAYLQIIEDTSAGEEPRRRAAHGLKGAASLLGLDRLSECGRKMEQILRQGLQMELWDEILLARVLLDELTNPTPDADSDSDSDSDLDPDTARTTTELTELTEKGEGSYSHSGHQPPGVVELEEEWDPETAQMLRQLFAEEARDHLDAINAALMKMEARPRQAPRELLDEALRKAHTLKGSAATVGLNGISRAAHMVEGRLVAMKQRHLLPDSGAFDRLLGATDVLGEMLEASSDEIADLLSSLQGILDGQHPLQEAGEPAAAPATLDSRAPDANTAATMERTEEIAEELTEEIAAELADEIAAEVTEEITEELTEELTEEIAAELAAEVTEENAAENATEATKELAAELAAEDAAEVTDVIAEEVTSDKRRPDAERRTRTRRGSISEGPAVDAPTVRVDVARLDQLMNTTSELVIDRTRIERRVEELRDLARELSVVRRDLHGVFSGLIGSLSDSNQEETAALESAVAASASNLDRAISSLDDDSESLRRTTQTLQDHLTYMRMIPIRWLHARLQRPLREMARSQGKQAELILHDEATEMDRSVVTQITDSLVQLVRNAVVHGIERPAQREAAGKPTMGSIEIAARHQGDVIFVEVKDDGAGIDPRQLRRLLAERGEMDQRSLDDLGDDEILDIIFTSGFTTRPEADELAGRGMGLDVVRQNIGKLGGDIRVSSEPGQGTRFAIQMPMTTAIAQALLFKSGDQVYAIPVAHVSETLFVEPEDLQEQGELCRLRTREGWIPLLYLHRVLGTPSPLPLQRLHDPQISHARQPVIVIRLGEVLLGITCSRIVGPRQIVLKGLGSLLAPHPMLAAATVSGSNKVQFVLDVAFLARAATLGVTAGPTPAAPGRDPAPRKLVLLVDDSRSVREAVGHILRRAGLAVETAPDGQAAWKKLQLRTYDLLLTDLEMPLMHGLELIARCRQASSLTDLPVVVLSSKTSRASREAAIKKGADLFLSKPINRRVLVRELKRYM